MKKFRAFIWVLVCITVVSCSGNDDNLSITYTNSDDYYSMKAHFNKSRTRDVDQYLERKIGRRSNMSFVNTKIDGTIALDDNTSFYIQKSPGILKIKLDKDANSEEAYERIKSLCEGIKSVVANSN